MASVKVSVTIAAPVERVFEVMTDLENAPNRVSGIKSLELLTPKPVGSGTRFRETRVMFGKEATEEMEITRFDPPRSYTVEAESHGTHYTSVLTFTPRGNSPQPMTDVDMTFEGRPLTTMSKVMGAVMMPFFRKACEKAMAQDLHDLKKAIETVG